MQHKVVAFIPARSGSKRIPDKNVKFLGDHPLLAYSIAAALESGRFDRIICVTDNEQYAQIARHYGAEVPALRPVEISGDKSSDIEWVLWALKMLAARDEHFDAFSILRPTGPFRQSQTINRAWEEFVASPGAESLRAVQKCRQHPGKMWVMDDDRMLPLMPFKQGGVPWHSRQYAALPEIYVQDASLEFAWTSIPLEKGTISGTAIVPFVSQAQEGFDLNDPEDWVVAEHLLREGGATLPNVAFERYQRKQ